MGTFKTPNLNQLLHIVKLAANSYSYKLKRMRSRRDKIWVDNSQKPINQQL